MSKHLSKWLANATLTRERRAEVTAKHSEAMYVILRRLDPILGTFVADDVYKGPMGDRLLLLRQATTGVLMKIEEEAKIEETGT